MAVRRRPEPGEDFEDFLSTPKRSSSEPQLRARAVASPSIPSLQRHPCDRFQFAYRDEDESPSQVMSAIERLHDEEMRKREERRLARTMEREQEFARQAPFAPRIRAPRRSGNEKMERHLLLYDKHLEMVQKRREMQEQKLRDEQEYLELHSVHRSVSSPRSPQASDAAVYQRLHEEAELKRQRLEQREKAAKPPSSPSRASSMTNLRLFHMASEAAEKRQKLQERKIQEEWEYLQMNSIHRAKSPQADAARTSQRLHEEAELKKQRLYEKQREKDLKASKVRISKTQKDHQERIIQRLYAPESRKKTMEKDREEEERWLRERQERRPVPRRAVSGPFRRLEPGDSPKATVENQATRVPGMSTQVPASTAEQVPEAPAATEERIEVETPTAVPTAEQIKAFCESTEALVLNKAAVEPEAAESGSLVTVSTDVAAKTEVASKATVESEAVKSEPLATVPAVGSALPAEVESTVPTADQIKAFLESTQALVESNPADAQGAYVESPDGTARRISLELEECF